MVFIDAAGDAHDGASGVLVPVGSAQACEGRDHIAAVGVKKCFTKLGDRYEKITCYIFIVFAFTWLGA